MKRSALALASACVLLGAAWAQQIPQGTHVTARVNEKISSATAKVGDRFTGVLTEPIVVNGQTLFDRGANVEGQVVKAEPSGRVHNAGVLQLALTSVSSGGRSASLNTDPWTLQGASHTKSNVTKIGGGAAAGAILGGIFGGGKGAAIGAGVGAAGGTGVAAATGKRDAVVESEAIIPWQTAQTAFVSQSRGGNNGYSRGQRGHGPAMGREYNDNGSQNGQGGYGQGGDYRVFSQADQQYIGDCLQGNQSGLPPGLAKRDRLPPGLERQVQKNGTLPPGLQKRVQPLPSQCQVRLPRLPSGWERVVLGSRVILLDPRQIIADMFQYGE